MAPSIHHPPSPAANAAENCTFLLLTCNTLDEADKDSEGLVKEADIESLEYYMAYM